MSVQAAESVLSERWSSYHKSAEGQLARLARNGWLGPQIAKLEELSSWAIASAMHQFPGDYNLPFVPVIPMAGLSRGVVEQYVNLVPVETQDLGFTEDLSEFTVPADGVPDEPYYLLAPGVRTSSHGQAKKPMLGESDSGRRYLSGPEIVALAIHADPQLLTRVGLWGGAVGHWALGERDQKIGVARPFINLCVGRRTMLQFGNANPTQGDRMVWPTCDQQLIRAVGQIVGRPR